MTRPGTLVRRESWLERLLAGFRGDEALVESLPVSSRLDDLPDGALVKVVGLARTRTPFAAPVTLRPAVLARTMVGFGPWPLRAHETHGVDFVLDAGHAMSTARIEIVEATLLGPAAAQSIIAPDDEVEVAGILSRQVDPTVAAAPGRGVRLGITIRALTIRRRSCAASLGDGALRDMHL